MRKFFATSFFLTFFFLFTSSASAATLQKPPNNLGLVGYWPMNEGTSTQAGDFSGRGNTGTLTGMANPPTATSGWGNGKLGGGLNFDGTNDYINLPNTLSDISGTVSTVSMWIKLTAYDTFGCVPFSMTNIYWQIASNTSVYVQASGVAITSTPFTDGTWRYLTMTSEANSTKVYVNGVLVGSFAAGGASIPTGAKNAAIGDYINGPAASWSCKGQLDDVRIYNRALSVAEIANLYQSGSAKINTSQNSKVTNGLVGLWSFDGADMSGTTAYDRSTSGNNGTLTNGPVRAIGKVGQGLSFDGSDDYVTLASAPPNSAVTFSAWINTNNTSIHQRIVGRLSGNPAHTNYGYGLSLYNGGILYCMNANADSGWFTNLRTTISANQWHFVTCTISGYGSGVTGVLYVDGLQMATYTGISSTYEYSPAIGGGLSNGPSCLFSGFIDDVRIYNRALTQAEITQLYNMGGSKLNAPQNNIPGSTLQSGLVGLWSFNGPDMSGNTAYDRSTSGNNGTLTNGPVRAIGKVGQGLAFDGSNDYVNSTSNFDSTIFSVCAWIYPTTSNTLARIITTPSGNTTKWSLIFNSSAVSFDVNTGSAPGTPTLTLNTWHHVCGTYDGTNKLLYYNGVSQGGSGQGSIAYDAGTGIRIGARHASTRFFAGGIDDVRIYNRTLTQAEVTQLYNLGK